MNLVKWLRKNNTKAMAVVVIVILFMFIGGDTLISTLQQKQSNKRLASYAGGRKMSITDLNMARQDLDVLSMVGMEQFLAFQDLRGLLLSELLFSERRPGPGVAERVSQMVRGNQFRTTDADIAKIYEGTHPPHVYWFLLKRESEEAGIGVPAEEIKQMLGRVIPQIYGGRTYAEHMAEVMNHFHLTEDDVLQTAARLMAVMQYAQVVCGTEDTTLQEASHMASNDQETLDVNYVRLDGKQLVSLVDSNEILTESAIRDQFDRHKAFLPGSITQENPHGFGYMLPPRIQVQYMFLKLDDIVSTVTTPGQEETEEYYRRYVDTLYTSQVSADPNDPNSPKVNQVKGYAEVVDNISKRLIAEKVLFQAESILQEAKSLADLEPNKPYIDIAGDIKKEFDITLHVGETGMLTMEDLNGDTHLGRLSISGRTEYPVPLSQMLFAMEPISMIDLQLLTLARPRLMESIGPLKHRWIQQRPTTVKGLTMALVRVSRAVTSQIPADMNFSYDQTGVQIEGIDPNTPRMLFSVRNQVEQDLRILAGFARAREEAARFMERVTRDGWDPALALLNQEVGDRLKEGPQDPNVFELQTINGLRRAQTGQLYMLARQSEQNPMARGQYQYMKTRTLLGKQLYPLVPAGQTQLTEPQLLIFKPEHSVYCVKDITVQRLSLEDYQKNRGLIAFREGYVQSQSLAVDHFNPDNIIARTGFVPEKTDADEDVAPEANDLES
jgi:hypothetical protein